MSETKDMRPRLVRALTPLDAIPVENMVGKPGTPDIEFAGGWIECKWLRRWPERERTVVRIPHYTQEQRAWLMRRWERGGWAGLMLQCGRDWLLFDAPAAQRVGYLDRPKLELTACWRTRLLNTDQSALVRFLKQCVLERMSCSISDGEGSESARGRRLSKSG